MSVKTAIVLAVLVVLLGVAVLFWGRRGAGADSGDTDWRERITSLDLGPSPIEAATLSVHPASCRRSRTELTPARASACRVVVPGTDAWFSVRSMRLCLVEGGPVGLSLRGNGQLLPTELTAGDEPEEGCLAASSLYIGPGSAPSTVELSCRGASCRIRLEVD